MKAQQIRKIIERRAGHLGVVDTPLKGVQLFHVTAPVQCTPAVYEPTVVAVVNGQKEVVWNGTRQVYEAGQYLCCTMPMPVEAGAPTASPENPLVGLTITLDTELMNQLVVQMARVPGGAPKRAAAPVQGLLLAPWDEAFADALWRLLQLLDAPQDIAILGEGRLRELYYAVLKGPAGAAVMRAFDIGNEIARAIEHISTHLDEPLAIEDLATQVQMSRAAFHRKFKQTTAMSPIQFVKSLRLNKAAMMISKGKNVSEAAMEVGYVSLSQFSREFKRMFGKSPRQWKQHAPHLAGMG